MSIDYPICGNLNMNNGNIKERLAILENRTGHTYGIRRKINDNSSSTWTRTNDAVGMNAAAKIATTSIPTNDFDKVYPWSQMKRCNINNGVYTFEDEPGFALDGSNGNVFLHVPKLWWDRHVETDENEDRYEVIEFYDFPKKGCHEELPFDIATYTICLDENNKAQSVSGKVPKYSYSKLNFMNRARDVGENYCVLDYRIFFIQMLYLVEYADANSQSKLGQGIVNYSNTAALKAESNTNKIVVATSVPTGLYIGKTVCIGTATMNNSIAADRQITAIEDYDDGTITGKEITFSGDAVDIAVGNIIWGSAQISGDLDDLGYHSGCKVNDGYHSVMYRFIENLIGNLNEHVERINIKDYRAYINKDATDFSNDKFTTPFEQIGYLNSNSNDKYIKEMGYDENHPEVMLPTVVNGSSSTCYCDNYWCGSGNKIACVGGSFNNNGAKSGLFAWGCGSTSSNANMYCGARLLHHQ